ncbi:hypothetical protein B0H10DRAFT_2215867 [Mycena sp. CBHHK59/15]|nr:hypothetical protein B0H10DRAFT_2215867 [Mycena sp. CBHHK59/15]
MSADAPSPPPVTIMSPPPSSSSNSSVTSLLPVPDAPQQAEIDPQILEALASKDRIYVLKLGELMEALINDRTLTRQRIDLSPATSYQRMLVHRCSAYYSLSPETDPLTKAISVLVTSESQVPARRLAELAPPPAEAPPKFKIMMRQPRSQTGSVAGDDGDISDVEASETGSLGGRSSASTSKKGMTIEERTAAYNEARSRIFMDFDEKDQKDAASSTSSSTSLVSGSNTSASGDDPGSPATESEWSGPSAAKKQPPNRSANSAASSSRSLRGSAPAFMSASVNGSSSASSRNSRAPSPAFKYPSLYEPPPQNQNGTGVAAIAVPPYDPAHPHSQAHSAPVPHHQQQQSPYYPPYSAHPAPYMQPPYPYYHHPQPYAAPYSHPSHGSDPELYAYNGANPYWYPHPNQNQSATPPGQGQGHVGANGWYDGTPTSATHPYAHAQGYYAPPPPQHMPMPPYMAPRSSSNSTTAGHVPMGAGVGAGAGGGGRGTQRSAWSYGPGVSGGVEFPSNAGGSTVSSTFSLSSGSSGASYGSGYPPLMRDAVGPRLGGGMGMRRGSSGSGNRTTSGSGSNDDVSSVASSSTTSSSSRQTYTSTTSSTQHHPLPPRPDWAVGLRPNPTLHSTARVSHHDHGQAFTNSRTMSPVSPPRALNGSGTGTGTSSPGNVHVYLQQQQQLQLSPPALTDFPPLTSAAAEKRPVAGAWTNSSSTRAIVMMPGATPTGQAAPAGGSALVQHVGEKGAGVEHQQFHPKTVRRPTTGGSAGGGGGKEKDRARGMRWRMPSLSAR